MNGIHVIKVSWRSTSKTLIIKARNAQAALDKAYRLKECQGVIDFEYIEERPRKNWKLRAI